MKKTILVIAFMILTSFINTKAQQGGISFNYFYSTLSPHGEWISIDYDLMVWRPFNVHSDWRPYSIGRWAWTDDGWYWDSYENFGWAVYHYGRWHFDDFYGWVWVPDYEWAPSWVEWRYNDDYLGWAPLSPYASFRAGFGISFSVNRHLHNRYWNFVRYDYFCHNDVNVYIIKNSENSRIFKNTKYRTNYFEDRGRIVNRGVDRDLVERRSGSKITTREISRVTTYNDYEKNIKSRGERITTFRPDEKEITRYKQVEKYNVRNSEGKSSLERDKISTRNRNNDLNSATKENKINTKREVESGRSYEPKKENNTRSKKEYSTSREKYSTESSSERKQVNRGRESKSSVGRSTENKATKKSTAEPKKETQTSRSKKR